MRKLIIDFEPTYIVDFAAQGMVAESWNNPTDWYQTNLISMVDLHDELRKLDCVKENIVLIMNILG